MSQMKIMFQRVGQESRVSQMERGVKFRKKGWVKFRKRGWVKFRRKGG